MGRNTTGAAVSDVYQHPQFAAFMAAVRYDPGDQLTQLAMSDWLRDAGETDFVAAEAIFVRWFGVVDIWNFGIGSSRGSGIVIGSGRGRGSGSGIGIGSGSGRGRGSGRGSGRGRGSVIGIGRGSGSGSGRGSGSGSEPYRIRHMRIGGQYLVHCGDWHTYVGRVVAQVGPGTYEMERVSKIAETNNGDCWHDLAAGDEKLRAACSYKHYKTKACIPLVIASFEWLGKLPQEYEA